MHKVLRGCSRAAHSQLTVLVLPARRRITLFAPLSRRSVTRRGFCQSTIFRDNAAAAVEDELPSTQPERATKFADLGTEGTIHPKIIETITRRMGLTTMTDVQSLTLNETLQGRDVLAQAKTGTGKTIAFLLPIFQSIINNDPSVLEPALRRSGDRSSRASDIRALVISPTRELAEQIAVEASKLAMGTGLRVQTAVGGTQKRYHLQKMQSEGCHILVGTPGRIKDIFSDPSSGVSAPKLTAFVLDEADRLLDDGFMPEIHAISDLMPPLTQQDRQTLLFSATIPRNVVQLARSLMKQDAYYVRTVSADDVPTHEKVSQNLVIVPGFANSLPALLEICDKAITKQSSRPFKAIVYFNATAETALAASIFIQLRRQPDSPLAGVPVYEIHGRLTQSSRSRAADLFRTAKSAILMSSDVTARGMDFPGVTHVIQVGVPPQRETYIHRIGRTARAGAEGEGVLVIPQAVVNIARKNLGDLPLTHDSSIEAAQVNFRSDPYAPVTAPIEMPSMSERARHYFDMLKTAAQSLRNQKGFHDTYAAMIGANMGTITDKGHLIGMLDTLSKVIWGMNAPPAVSRGLITRLGLRDVPSLNSRERTPFVGFEDSGETDSFRDGGRTFGRGGRDGGRDLGRDWRGFGRDGGRDFGRDYGRGSSGRGSTRLNQGDFASGPGKW